ncbi:MAG: hypothetical protein PUF70_03245 [Absicoccus porci]|uniref:hypothetical protein n=1 Tax=Absicoccus porci TaxID=2486576 RepID=UPI0024091308|nr:hypothetical protein [Absicoccus porci]MDD6459690.1 hypothetical protein [Absicoccus porci]
MNFVENNGKKVAAILCVASALPVVGTIYAMESQPGWHGDKYVKKDHTIAKNSWITSNKKSIYLDKDGKADTEKTYNASATALSDDTVATVADSVKASTVEAVDTESNNVAESAKASVSVDQTDVADTKVATVVDETKKADTADVLEKAASTSDVVTVVADNTQNTATTPVKEETTTVVQQPTTTVDNTQTTTPTNTQTTTPTQPAAPTNNTQTTTPAQPATPANNTQTTTPAQPTAPADNTQTTTPTTPTNTTTQNSSFNERVAQAALAEIGEHEWCTNTATDALNAAAGSEVYGVYWPDQYQSLGTVFTDRSLLQPGNLVYYANDGRAGSEGVVVPDHIAVYVGNDTVVNGGWGYTANVAASNIDVPSGTQYYIAINQ